MGWSYADLMDLPEDKYSVLVDWLSKRFQAGVNPGR